MARDESNSNLNLMEKETVEACAILDSEHVKVGKDGLLFIEEFILNVNLVGQGPQRQIDLECFLANFSFLRPGYAEF